MHYITEYNCLISGLARGTTQGYKMRMTSLKSIERFYCELTYVKSAHRTLSNLGDSIPYLTWGGRGGGGGRLSFIAPDSFILLQ